MLHPPLDPESIFAATTAAGTGEGAGQGFPYEFPRFRLDAGASCGPTVRHGFETSHSTTRSIRAPIEFTFHVAIRTSEPYGANRRPSPDPFSPFRLTIPPFWRHSSGRNFKISPDLCRRNGSGRGGFSLRLRQIPLAVGQQRA